MASVWPARGGCAWRRHYGSVIAMSTVAFDVAAVRRRFSALDRSLAFFDGPGGTQVPDSVIDAIAGYLRESNANVGGPYETSRQTEALIDTARETAARWLGCTPEETVFGANMTTLNFALTRALGRELREGDEVVVTRLDHDANVAPWLELQRDLGIVVRFAEIEEDCSLDYDDLARQLSARTRVVAFPWAANSVGTHVDAARVVELAHEAGALAWIDAVHYAPHGPIDVSAVGADVLDLLAVQVLRAAPRARVRALGAARALAAVQGAPGAGAPARPPLRDRDDAARAARRLRRRGRVLRVARLRRDRRVGAGARRALPRRPPRRRAAVRPADDGGPRPDVRVQRRGPLARRRSRRSSAAATSRSGGATTTRSRR